MVPAVPVDGNAASLLAFNPNDAIGINDPCMMLLDSLGDGNFLCLNLDAVGALPTPPKRLTGAEDRPDYHLWLRAAQKDLEEKQANGTYELVDRPVDKPVVKTGIRFTYKYDTSTGALLDETGHRARWYGCGYSQTFGEHGNYWETYTATTKSAGIRCFGLLCARLRLETEHVDVVKAFTRNKLVEEVYGEQMEKFVEGGYLPDGRPKKVCKFLMGLEGLKQAGNTHQKNNVSHIVNNCKMRQSVIEPTLFYRHFKNGILLLLVWVDDIWAAFTPGSRRTIFDPFMLVYQTRYPCKRLGPIKRFVSIDVAQSESYDELTLSMESYLTNMIPKYLSKDELEKHETLPAAVLDKHGRHDTYSKLSLATCEAEKTLHPFLSALAAVLYAVCMVRGDVAFHVSFLSRFSCAATDAAWKELVRLMCYLWHTRSLKLKYRAGSLVMPIFRTARPPMSSGIFNKMHGLLTISDASWKVDSTYCGVMVLGGGAALDWKAQLVKVKLSSTEAEIGAGSIGGKRLVYIRGVIGEILALEKLPVMHVIDNSAMPALTENVGVSRKTEHFRRWLHYLRYLVTHGFSFVHLVRTFEMHANSLTKVEQQAEYLAFRKIFFGY